MGLVTGLSFGLSDHALAAIGGYSLVSTWMLETQRLEEEHQLRDSVANVVSGVLLGLSSAPYSGSGSLPQHSATRSENHCDTTRVETERLFPRTRAHCHRQ